jgi:Zn-dependent M28 family amino/carboxypeptidase
MKKLLFFICFFAGTNVLFAQTDTAAKYAEVITGNNLRKHLGIIAGAPMEGRETGTAGQRKAAAYIESQFKAMGLKSVDALKGYQQFYPLYQDALVTAELKVRDTILEYGKDYIVQLNNNENGKFKGNKIVFAGYGIEDNKNKDEKKNYDDYNGLDVKGKIVLIFLGEPKRDGKYFLSGVSGRSSDWTFPGIPKKLALAAAKGAAGVLVINPSVEVFNERAVASAKKTNVFYPRANSTEKMANYAQISHAFAKKIMGNNFDTLLKIVKASGTIADLPVAIGRGMEVRYKYYITYKFEKYRDTINASNVVGFIEGTDKKDEYVFVTGHYDHLGIRDGKIYYGADDDGSGTCAVINMAEAFSKAAAEGNRPRRTMVFMTVSGEEKGLWGSQYYSDNPFFPLDKTTVDLNIDMIGRTDTERMTGDTLNYVYVIGHDKLSSDLPIINEGVNNKYTNLVLDYKFDDPNDREQIYFRSDHYNFARKGVPVLFFYDGMLKADYHKPTDTVDKINWDLYEKRARMIFHTAWEMANRDAMLKRDTPLNMGTR